jgi:hypothetical protein
MVKKSNNVSSLRSQFKATPISKLKKIVDEDNAAIGAQSNEYLSLEDGKTVKVRIFPGHPGVEGFYVKKKCYWLPFTTKDGEPRRSTVLDSIVHGGTKLDIVDEYTKFAKKKCTKDAAKIEALTGNGPNSNSLNPQYSWLCYADKVSGDEELKAKLWEFKSMVRNALNKLSFSEDEDEPIEVDPFTDIDEGVPVMVKYMKTPNKKKGEQYYDVTFPKKMTARPLSDGELEYFAGLKPLTEVLPPYGMNEFDRALEGLQNFDEEHEIGLFEDEDWLVRVEEIKEQYEGRDCPEDDDEPKKKTSKKKVSKVVEEDEDETEEEEEKPKKKATSKKSKVVEEEEETEEEEEETEEEEEEETPAEDGDELDELDRSELKKYIKDNDLEVTVKKSMSDDDIREAIREAMGGEEETEEEEETEDDDEEQEEEKPKAKLSLKDIQNRLKGKK